MPPTYMPEVPVVVEHNCPQPALAQPSFHQWGTDPEKPWALHFRVDGGYLIRFPDAVDFHIPADGSHIRARLAPGVGMEHVRHLILNQATPLALSRQGRLVLHGASVDLDGRALAFLGQSGQGKSTLCAALCRHGAPFLTDDGLYLDSSPASGWTVLPSHPSIRLWQDSESALFPNTETTRKMGADPKARLMAGPELVHCDGARPLSGIYVLGPPTDAEVLIEPIPPSGLLRALPEHIFQLDIEDSQKLAHHFDALIDLVKAVPAYTLRYPRRYDLLPQVIRQLKDHHLQAQT